MSHGSNFADLKDDLQEHIGRSLDERTPNAINNAIFQSILWHERNYDFPYARSTVIFSALENQIFFTIAAGIAYNEIKRIESVSLKYYDTNGVLLVQQLAMYKPEESMAAPISGRPMGYFINPVDLMGKGQFTWLANFNSLPDQTYTGQAILRRFHVNMNNIKNVPTSSHPLVDIGYDVIKWMSLMNLSSILRKLESHSFYESMWQRGIQTLNRYNYEIDKTDSSLEQLEYNPGDQS